MYQYFNNTSNILDDKNHMGIIPYGHNIGDAFAILITIAFTLITSGGVVFNIILIFTIVTDKNLRSKTSNIFMVNLAVGDLITAVFVTSFDTDIIHRGYFPYHTIICGLKDAAFLLSLSSSMNSLLIMTIDRYISLKYPFKKIRHFTTINIIIVIVFGWLYAVLFSTFPVIYNYKRVQVTNGLCTVFH